MTPVHTSKMQPASRTPGFMPVAVELREHFGATRAQAEQFIRENFERSFGARVEAFMPRLFSLRSEEGQLCGAFGLRTGTGRLFLEQYLDSPIELEIATRLGCPVQRSAVVEVGQFCGSYPGVARAMIRLLTEQLHDEGFEWVVFTGTASLRNAFFRMGLAPTDIHCADGARLRSGTRESWGSYYDNMPRVLVGHVGAGYQTLQRVDAAGRQVMPRMSYAGSR